MLVVYEWGALVTAADALAATFAADAAASTASEAAAAAVVAVGAAASPTELYAYLAAVFAAAFTKKQRRTRSIRSISNTKMIAS